MEQPCLRNVGVESVFVRIVEPLEAAVELFAERSTDQTDRVKFDVYVRDAHFALVSGATVLLNVADTIFHMDQVGKGRYVAEVENIVDEAIIATAQAEADGAFLGERTIAVNLPPARSEMANVELDSEFLRALAKRLNGKYFDIDDISGEITEMFEATTRVSSLSRMASVWPRWALLLALCLILGFNWFVRRAVGLV